MDETLKVLLERIFPYSAFKLIASVYKSEVETAILHAKDVQSIIKSLESDAAKKQFLSAMHPKEAAERALGIAVWKILSIETGKTTPSQTVDDILSFLKTAGRDSERKEIVEIITKYVDDNYINKVEREFDPFLSELQLDPISREWLLTRINLYKSYIEENANSLAGFVNSIERAEYRIITVLRDCLEHRKVGWAVETMGLNQDKNTLAVLIGDRTNQGRREDPYEKALANDPEAIKVIRSIIAYLDFRINIKTFPGKLGLADDFVCDLLCGCINDSLSPTAKAGEDAVSQVRILIGKTAVTTINLSPQGTIRASQLKGLDLLRRNLFQAGESKEMKNKTNYVRIITSLCSYVHNILTQERITATGKC